MRVGFIAGWLGTENGWARLSLETIRHVTALGVDCRVVVAADNDPGREKDIPESRPALPRWPRERFQWPLEVAMSLPASLRALSDCDVLHCLVEPYIPVASLVSRLSSTPLVATAVGTYAARTRSLARRRPLRQPRARTQKPRSARASSDASSSKTVASSRPKTSVSTRNGSVRPRAMFSKPPTGDSASPK